MIGVMASHLPRFLTATCRVMVILPSPQGHHDKPKSLPTIKEGSRTFDTIKKAFTQKEKQPQGSLGSHKGLWDARPQHWRRLWEPLFSQRRRCPHLPGAARRLEETKAISNSAKPWKDDNWRSSDKCRLSFRKQQD
ncbi:hypothetical protein CK203_041200 [Vitis vinifera]|uniref:Uncharacterized protein n=1 Tax=Vitis vinifera TaxID=29760 RepID=A0A438HT80_VITVI|nr:hypothetical protein CK203_041200 [Vitis vinifera]